MWPKELQGKGTGKINIHLLHVLYFFFDTGNTMAIRTNIQKTFFPALKSEINICQKLLPWNLNIFL